MGKLLGTNGGVVDMLMECSSVAMYRFFSAWKHKMESFRESSPPPSKNLMPPPAVSQSMTRLEEILATADTSLATEDTWKGQITAVLQVILTPLQSLCEGVAQSLGPLERTIYLANLYRCDEGFSKRLRVCVREGGEPCVDSRQKYRLLYPASINGCLTKSWNL